MIKFAKTKNHYLLLDTEAKITKGMYFLLGGININKYMGEGERLRSHLSERIIAYLSLNDSYILDNVLLLPPLEKDNYEELYHSIQDIDGTYQSGWVDGYNSPKGWSNDHMKTAMLEYAKWITGGPPSRIFAATAELAQEKILKQLSTLPTPIDFIPEYETEAFPAWQPTNHWTDTGNTSIGRDVNYTHKILKIEKGVLQGTYKF